MSKPIWWSQPNAPEGSTIAEAIIRNLGTPHLDPLAILVREAAQNSWDARASDDVPVRFTLALDQLGDTSPAWRDLLLPSPDRAAKIELASALTDESYVLRVSDRGTLGLGGPTRADVAVSADRPDFVNLVRNIGAPRDQHLGGGTYGFGKGIFFAVSSVGTVLIRTRALVDGKPQTRLIGVAVGTHYASGTRRYTGRHWLGVPGPDGITDPMLDADGDAIARSLGLEPYGSDDFGTDVLVVSPKFGSSKFDDDEPAPGARTPREAAEYLASAVLWNLWPKIVDRGAGPPMRFSVACEGTAIAIPEPATLIELEPFVSAFMQLDDSVRGQDIASKAGHLGRFAVAKQMAPTRSSNPAWIEIAAPFFGPAHHCALMRAADLIVGYREGPVCENEALQYAAVFRASESADEVFARAEPPTHDDWVIEGLEGEEKAAVRAALTAIRRRLSDIAFVRKPAVSPLDSPPLGALAQKMAGLLGSTISTGPGGGGGGGGGGGTGPLVRIIGSPRLVVVDDGSVEVRTEVEIVNGVRPISAAGATFVVIDGGRESEPPVGKAVPTVLGWREAGAPDSAPLSANPLSWNPGDGSRWTLVVQPAEGAVTGVTVGATAVDHEGAGT